MPRHVQGIPPDNWHAIRQLYDSPNHKRPTQKRLLYAMAEANYQLPDRNPLKITRERCAAVMAAAIELRHAAREYRKNREPVLARNREIIADNLEALYWALRALLPPR